MALHGCVGARLRARVAWRRLRAAPRSGRTICARPRSFPPNTRKSRAGSRARRATTSPKGEWWKAFRDRRTRPARGGGRGLQPDLEGGRGQLPAGAGADRRGAGGAVPDAQFRSDARLAPARAPASDMLDAEVSASWTLDVWGKVRRAIEEQGAAAAGRAPPISPTRRCRRNRRWRSPMCSCARPIRARSLRRHRQAISALARHRQEPVQRRHRGQVRRHHRAGATARRAGAGDQHRRRARSRASTRSRC